MQEKSPTGRYVVCYCDIDKPKDRRSFVHMDLSDDFPEFHSVTVAINLARSNPKYKPRSGFVMYGVVTYEDFAEACGSGEVMKQVIPEPHPDRTIAGVFVEVDGERRLCNFGVLDLIFGPTEIEEAKRVFISSLKLDPKKHDIQALIGEAANKAKDLYEAITLKYNGKEVCGCSFRKTLHPRQIYQRFFASRKAKNGGLKCGYYYLYRTGSNEQYLFEGVRYDARVKRVEPDTIEEVLSPS